MPTTTIVFHRRLQIAAALLACTAAWPFSATPAAAGNEELLKRVPAGANALVIIDVRSLLATKMAIAKGWGDRDDLAYAERPILVPPEAETALVAAQLDAENRLGRIWELAVLDLPDNFNLEQIARTEGGYVDSINDTQVVWTPSDAYVVDLGAPELGIVYPADRQYVSRWIGFSRRNESVAVSEYLQQAAELAGPKTQVVMALDLLDAIPPHQIKDGLSTTKTLAGNQKRLDQIASVVAGIRGVTLTIGVSAEARGKLRVDFSDDASVFYSQAKPLVLEVLDRFDAHLPDLDTWAVRTEGQTIELEGTFSESGLRRVASLLEVPTEKFSDLRDQKPAEEGSDDYTRASLAYYRGVKALLDDLRETLDDTRDNHALWMERFGRRVDAMPILNVDDDLLDWGSNVSATFRDMAFAERQSGIRGGARKASVNGGASFGYAYGAYGGFGYYVRDNSEQQRNVIDAEERAQARTVRYESWNELENATADIRRKMTQKYGVEF